MKFLTLLSVSLFASFCLAQTPQSPDLTRTPTLYVVGYAHLDTQWRWEYPKVIREYLPDTLHKNFELFEKYPHYIFNFSGANRYRMMKEYYPADYQRLQRYVAAGRWFPAGSSMEESDVNSPSAESIIRQVLYGNEFFRHDFGRASAEYMLPDCFGFPASLPSLLAHAGIKGFSTQKLTWHSSAPAGGPDSPEKTPVGIPFNVGYWVEPDGKGVIAALNPGSYDGNVSYDLTKSDPGNTARDYVDWPRRIDLNGQVSGLFTDYHYYGTGDIGGSPGEASVAFMEAIATKGNNGEAQVGAGPLHVISSTAEQMFLDIRPAQISALPRYHGDLELIEHSAGSLSSQAYHKRWNRKNELLADAAERASVAASQFAGLSYPQERLNNAWTLLLRGQFHDIMAGTATPQAYEYSWNDDVLAMNQFAGVLTSASAAIASRLDTQSKGVPIVVYNPLNIAREDVVEATISFPGGIPPAVRVFGPDGKEVAAQLEAHNLSETVLFQASVPPVGYTVYDVQPIIEPVKPLRNPVAVTESSLENARYRIKVDTNGDVSSIFDKKIQRELLSSPLRLAFQTEKPHDWPAWNMDWTDQQKPPRSYVGGAAKIHVVERGPVRASLEIERESEGSKFIQTIRLSGGDAGNRVEFQNRIDWKASAAALKAVFSLSASNPLATYSWDVGTIQRGNNDPHKYEVPSHQWFDLSDKSGAYGVTILSDCKYGSDKPDDNTLRLTLIYTPGLGDGNGRFYSDQATQDWGHHNFVYGLAAHAGTWQSEQTDWQALRLNQPLIAFASSRHTGALGRTFSLMSVNTTGVRVLALKKAERNDELVLRLVEMEGRQQKDVQVKFARPVITAREINGQEFPLANASVSGGALVTSFTPYQLRTFALKLAPPTRTVTGRNSVPIALPYDLSVASSNGSKSAPGFDAQGRALPAEMLPDEISWSGIRFKLAPATKPNALSAKGQTIPLPAGPFRRLYLLAASAEEDQKAAFRVGNAEQDLVIQNWSGFIGQWDDRTWNKKEEQLPPRPGAPAGAPPRVRSVMEYTGIKPGFIKRSDVAWFASHRHTAAGEDEPYSYSYLFAYSLEIPPGARTLMLPNNDKIRILAVTVSDKSSAAHPAQALYDTLGQPQ